MVMIKKITELKFKMWYKAKRGIEYDGTNLRHLHFQGGAIQLEWKVVP